MVANVMRAAQVLMSASQVCVLIYALNLRCQGLAKEDGD
jgi:hypothetical protein